jgi:hypothetical protein
MSQISVIAKLTADANLESYITRINAGRTDGTYFYKNGLNVSVHNPHSVLSEEDQKSDLHWLLKGHDFTFSL